MILECLLYANIIIIIVSYPNLHCIISGFVAEVEVCGKKYLSKENHSRKVDAAQAVAEMALRSLGLCKTCTSPDVGPTGWWNDECIGGQKVDSKYPLVNKMKSFLF